MAINLCWYDDGACDLHYFAGKYLQQWAAEASQYSKIREV